MTHKQTIMVLYIELFIDISVEIIYKMVKYLRMHMCALDFGSILLSLLVKENKQWNKNNLFIIYNSPSSKYSVTQFYSEDAHK